MPDAAADRDEDEPGARVVQGEFFDAAPERGRPGGFLAGSEGAADVFVDRQERHVGVFAEVFRAGNVTLFILYFQKR